MMKSQRVAKKPKIPEKKRPHTQHNLGVGGEDTSGQNERETARRKPFGPRLRLSFLRLARGESFHSFHSIPPARPLQPVLKMGGAGDPPAPVGDPPDRTST